MSFTGTFLFLLIQIFALCLSSTEAKTCAYADAIAYHVSITMTLTHEWNHILSATKQLRAYKSPATHNNLLQKSRTAVEKHVYKLEEREDSIDTKVAKPVFVEGENTSFSFPRLNIPGGDYSSLQFSPSLQGPWNTPHSIHPCTQVLGVSRNPFRTFFNLASRDPIRFPQSILRTLRGGRDKRKQNKYVFKCQHERNDTLDLNMADTFVKENRPGGVESRGMSR